MKRKLLVLILLFSLILIGLTACGTPKGAKKEEVVEDVTNENSQPEPEVEEVVDPEDEVEEPEEEPEDKNEEGIEVPKDVTNLMFYSDDVMLVQLESDNIEFEEAMLEEGEEKNPHYQGMLTGNKSGDKVRVFVLRPDFEPFEDYVEFDNTKNIYLIDRHNPDVRYILRSVTDDSDKKFMMPWLHITELSEDFEEPLYRGIKEDQEVYLYETEEVIFGNNPQENIYGQYGLDSTWDWDELDDDTTFGFLMFSIDFMEVRDYSRMALQGVFKGDEQIAEAVVTYAGGGYYLRFADEDKYYGITLHTTSNPNVQIYSWMRR